jgi:hypothetical protein
MRRSLVVLVLALALAACGPSIKPAMKSATDQLAAAPRAGARDVGAERQLSPVRWAVGQWTLSRTVNEKGEPSYVRTAVVGREDGGWWVEMETQDYYKHAFTKVLYASMPTTVDEAFDAVRKIVTRNEEGKKDQVMDFAKDDPAMAIAKRFVKQYMTVGVAAVPEGVAREDAAVPAGKFRGCARFETKVDIAGLFSVEATSWFHPAVPLSGSVKSVSKDGKWTTELVDYGLTGATSRM